MASSRSSDECYRCHQLGHWAQDCSINVTEERPHFSLLDDIFPEKMCSCGSGPCIIRISNSQRNPGRKYYKCYLCGSFEWCDERRISSSQSLSPNSSLRSPSSPLRNPNPNSNSRLQNINPNREGGNPNLDLCSSLRNLNLNSNSPLWNSNPNHNSLPSTPDPNFISRSWNHSSNLNSPSWDLNPSFLSQNPIPNPVSPARGLSPNSPMVPNPLSPSQNHNSNSSPRGEFGYQQRFSSPSNDDKISRSIAGNDDSLTQCPCGAGPCPVRITKNGRNTGRKYVACPVRKGEGSCGFFEWRDELNSAHFSYAPLRNDFITSQQDVSVRRHCADGTHKSNLPNNWEKPC